MWDCIVIGAGPAGLSAAVNLRQRSCSCLVLGAGDGALAKAPLVNNCAGLPGLSGKQLLEALRRHALEMGAELQTRRVGGVMTGGETLWVSVGADVEECRSVVLACGAARAKPLPGEEAFLGRGVSSCATCDGMLFRGKRCVVWGTAQDAARETAYLAEIGVDVTFLGTERPDGLPDAVPFVKGDLLRIEGDDAVRRIVTDSGEMPCDGVFLLREAVAPTQLIPGLTVENGFVRVDRQMATGLPGIFAAGDCTGTPLQVSKALGEGQIAGLSAAAFCR